MKIKRKNGISLIVLIITIIVMVILSSAVIISLNNNGIIRQANEAVKATNLNEVKNLATLIWAEAYLDEVENIDEQYIRNKLAEKGINTYDYNIIVTENGVNVVLNNEEWVTIYSGNGYTETGSLTVANSYLFNQLDQYRITIEGDEYTGTLDAIRPILYNGVYVFAAVSNNSAVYAYTFEDLLQKQGNLPSDAVLITAAQSIDSEGNEICNMWFSNPTGAPVTTGYRVVKIEQLVDRKIVFQGDVAQNSPVYLENVDTTRVFMLEHNNQFYEGTFKNDGVIYFEDLTTGEAIGKLWPGSNEALFFGNDRALENIVLYNLNENPNLASENGHLAKNINGKWTLMTGSSVDRPIPLTVEGKTITAVRVAELITVYYSREIDIFSPAGSEIWGIITVAAGVNPQKIFEGLLDIGKIGTFSIDLTALSDVTIPDEVFELFGTSNPALEIYVTETVKAKYQDYDVVKVKTN